MQKLLGYDRTDEYSDVIIDNPLQHSRINCTQCGQTPLKCYSISGYTWERKGADNVRVQYYKYKLKLTGNTWLNYNG